MSIQACVLGICMRRALWKRLSLYSKESIQELPPKVRLVIKRKVKMVTSSSSEGKKNKEKKNKNNDKKAAELHEKLQLLRSITHSHALNEASVVLDASRYIQELQHRVESLDQDTSTAQHSSYNQSSLPVVTVETLEKGFLITVISEISSQVLLCSVLESFEELGLNVLEARVSCMESFQLQVIAENEEGDGSIDSQTVRSAVVQAIRSWGVSNDDQD
ncbi:uncharacterized protein LOC116216091 isoform X2 [Punica granatum]|uniref:Uncharacterized protein LOC116216091 isoform X2 n=1 Tax=Punica granatum TaxID=22663 RepID=A0A6P8EMZ1_PUNGR|nr:uncharacterized protein LOC116216091 isoform X2 [Punica granatum]